MKQTMQDYNDWSLENFIKILREKFRHRDFWKFQYEAITNILNKKSTLVVKTTGAGKSLIYQFASLIMQKGLTLVITPLLSLMLDQISNISPCLRAACINSLISIQKRKKIWELVKKGKVNVTSLPSPTTHTHHFIDSIRHPRMPAAIPISKNQGPASDKFYLYRRGSLHHNTLAQLPSFLSEVNGPG